MSGANPKISITGNEKSDPFDLRAAADRTCFTLTGGTGGTVRPQYSNLEGTKADSDWTNAASVLSGSGNSGPYATRFGVAKFIRFVASNVTGTITIRFARTKNDRGSLIDIGVEAPPPAQVTA